MNNNKNINNFSYYFIHYCKWLMMHSCISMTVPLLSIVYICITRHFHHLVKRPSFDVF